jgi:uncharacterized phage protein (TIGR02218 family)
MKRLHPELFNELKRTSAMIVTAFKLVRADGTVYGFTYGDLPFTYDGVEYSPTNAFSGTAAAAKTNFSVDNMNAVALLTDKFTAADLKGGLFDNARVYVFWIRPDKPEWGICPIRGGRIGEITLKQGTFETELRSVAQRIQQRAGPVYTIECPATYGDERCGMTVATVHGRVTTKVARWKWIDKTLDQATNWFRYGHVTWLTGANAGMKCEVRDHQRTTDGFAQIQLLEAMPHVVEAGDTYTITRGCDKSRLTCRERGNLINYRGFPDMPTEDKALATPNFSGSGKQKKDDSGS